MWMCILCHCDVLADDIAVLGVKHCICLHCYVRETESGKRMDKPLRETLSALLNSLPD